MHKVTERIAIAFKEGRKLTVGNTSTDGVSVWLHGNKIAEKVEGNLRLSMCGWPTVTTRERLNGILETFGFTTRFYQKKQKAIFRQYPYFVSR